MNLSLLPFFALLGGKTFMLNILLCKHFCSSKGDGEGTVGTTRTHSIAGSLFYFFSGQTAYEELYTTVEEITPFVVLFVIPLL